MRHPWAMRIVVIVVTAAGATAARADYNKYGQGMQVVASGTLTNGGLDIQTVSPWLNAGAPISTMADTYTLNTTFTGPACDSIVASRLVLSIWGANASNTCRLDVSANGTSLGSVSFGGDGLNGSTLDPNPAFSTSQTNVYGGGSGVWLVSIPITNLGVLNRNAANNDFALTLTPLYQGGSVPFDGRFVQASLVSLYQKADLNNSFAYALAEGTGDIYRGTTGAEKSRSASLGTADTANVAAATLRALYTYGDLNQNDRLYFNGVPLGGDDIAQYAGTSGHLNYGPDLVSFDVTSALAGTNSLEFSVDAADGIPGTLESSLRPSLAILTIAQVPEPASIAMLTALLAAAWWAWRRGRPRAIRG